MKADPEDSLFSGGFENNVHLIVEAVLAALGWFGMIASVVLADVLANPESGEVTLSATSMQKLLMGLLIAGAIWYRSMKKFES